MALDSQAQMSMKIAETGKSQCLKSISQEACMDDTEEEQDALPKGVDPGTHRIGRQGEQRSHGVRGA